MLLLSRDFDDYFPQVLWAGVLWLQRAREQQPRVRDQRRGGGRQPADPGHRVLPALHQAGDCGECLEI